MSDIVVLYASPMSRGRIAHWMLEEVGVPYRYEPVNLERGEQKRPEFLALNPMGKVPAIVHRGTVITEAGAICAYLADAFPQAGLAPPPDSALRGTYYRWMFFAGCCVEVAVIDRMLSRPPASRPTALGYGSYDDTIATLERALAPGPYILGERFSAADVYIGSQIGFGMRTRALEERPAFQQYLARLQQRPAHQRFIAQGEEILARMKKAG
ncbi:MAG TPA: glutathione S-transferase family protein [Candidatus Dormibacteraeota bacterium]|nr:glutathione S-transferase family protein [Candidatus Dormibacteraeota bacterium]